MGDCSIQLCNGHKKPEYLEAEVVRYLQYATHASSELIICSCDLSSQHLKKKQLILVRECIVTVFESFKFIIRLFQVFIIENKHRVTNVCYFTFVLCRASVDLIYLHLLS